MTPFEKLLLLCDYFNLDVFSEKCYEGNAAYRVCIRKWRGAISGDSIKSALAPSVDEAAQTILDDMKETIEAVFGLVCLRP